MDNTYAMYARCCYDKYEGYLFDKWDWLVVTMGSLVEEHVCSAILSCEGK